MFQPGLGIQDICRPVRRKCNLKLYHIFEVHYVVRKLLVAPNRSLFHREHEYPNRSLARSLHSPLDRLNLLFFEASMLGSNLPSQMIPPITSGFLEGSPNATVGSGSQTKVGVTGRIRIFTYRKPCDRAKNITCIAGWWYTYPLKDMSSSDWIIIPTIGENNIHVPNHQPDRVVYGHL